MTASVVSGSEILLYEDFSGNALDQSVWYVTNSGGANDFITVNNGVATIFTMGNARHNNIRTHEDRFNFHHAPITVEVELAAFPEPDPWSTASFLWSSLWFNLGGADSGRNARLLTAQEKGFTFALNWRPPSDTIPQNIFIGGDYNTLGENHTATDQNTLMSGVPSKIVFTVDRENFWILLEGATFLEGDFDGDDIMTGQHGLTEYELEEYKLMIGLQSRGSGLPLLSASIASVTVMGELVDLDPPEPTEWAGFPIGEDNWVNTGEWMGMLYIGSRPWVYADRIQRWIYLPEQNVLEDHSGAWIGMDPF